MGRGTHARRRRRGASRGVAMLVVVLAIVAGGGAWAVASHRAAPAPARADHAAKTPRTAKPRSSTTTTVPGPPPGSRPLRLIEVIGGPISPKSVDATATGLVFAQNMMYRHTMTVYRSNGVLRRTIPDSVVFSHFGIGGHPGVSRG